MSVAAQLEPVAPLLEADDFPKGTVVVPAHDLARYHQFTHDLLLLDVPDGTKVAFQRSSSIVQNLNNAVVVMMEDETLEWAFFLGDDHAFERDLCVRMLRHDVDIVGPLCTMRGPPFSLVHFSEHDGEDDLGRPLYLKMGFDELPEEGGLFEVNAAGMAGMLVKRRVFEALRDAGDLPYFKNTDTYTVNEDVEWCRRVRDLGFKVLIDADSRIGHMGAIVAWPDRKNDQWGLTIDFQGAGENRIFIPGGIRLDKPTLVKGQVEIAD